ncbi:MAG: ornithine cyclodeaminase family protein [Alphaproteobacteria bacterium]|jgi:ornithine cyclodeaminase/alanine dehydrogenase-like protein (mu-crystallin family)|nr:ornithine cyclodeaminase family protein [Alphaproteobacteria bacterium]
MVEVGTFLYLSEQTLSELGVTTDEAIDAIERLIRGASNGTVWSAPKAVVQPPDGRYLMATVSAADDPPFLAVKSLVLNPANSDRGLQQINASVTLLDSQTGLPVAVMDGNWVTAVRTAALSAVAAKRMALRDSKIAAFIGCGVQAQSHLKAFADLFPLGHARVFGRGRTNIEALCQTATDLGLEAVVCETAHAAVTGADLVITTVTYSPDLEPFVDAGWLKPGAFATVTDLAAPWIKDSLSNFQRIVIDDREQEASLPNKLAPPEQISGDLSELVLGAIDGRASSQDRTAFIFRAHPLGDLALAALAYQKACERGLGTSVQT